MDKLAFLLATLNPKIAHEQSWRAVVGYMMQENGLEDGMLRTIVRRQGERGVLARALSK